MRCFSREWAWKQNVFIPRANALVRWCRLSDRRGVGVDGMGRKQQKGECIIHSEGSPSLTAFACGEAKIKQEESWCHAVLRGLNAGTCSMYRWRCWNSCYMLLSVFTALSEAAEREIFYPASLSQTSFLFVCWYFWILGQQGNMKHSWVKFIISSFTCLLILSSICFLQILSKQLW